MSSVGVLLLVLSSCNSTLEGDQYAVSAERGFADLKVVYIPADGFAYKDENGELTGVGIDIMQEFADFVSSSHGIELRYNFIPERDFSTFYNKVKESTGGVFGLGNVTITESRREELRFSPPYLTNIAVLITHDSAEQLSSLEQIGEEWSHKTALAFGGTLHETRIRDLKNQYWQDMPVDLASSNTEILERVSTNPDLFSYVDIYNYWRAAESGMALKQHTVGDQPSERFGIIMPLSSDWELVVTDFFERGQGFRTSRVYRSILENHLGPELTEKLEAAREAFDTE